MDKLLMKIVKGILILALLSPFSSLALAGQSFNGLQVNFVGTGWGSEGYYVNTSNSIISSAGCGPDFMLEPGNPMAKTILAMLISAFHTGAKVNLYAEVCISSGIMRLKAAALVK